jgi:sterol desaturase/sphingolipid hydroxylase (fatty acid hydroxylase superfamily)
MVLIDDFIFYAVHRTLHMKTMYTRFHKTHHTYKNTLAPAVFHSHPLDFIFSYTAELWLGPLLVYYGILDLVTIYSYVFVGIIGAVVIHAGVEARIPFTNFEITQFHQYHHLNFKNHYGVWGITDYVLGTADMPKLENLNVKQE